MFWGKRIMLLRTTMRLKIKMRIFLTTNMMLLKKNVTLKRRMLIFLTKKLEDIIDDLDLDGIM